MVVHCQLRTSAFKELYFSLRSEVVSAGRMPIVGRFEFPGHVTYLVRLITLMTMITFRRGIAKLSLHHVMIQVRKLHRIEQK